MFIQSTGFTFRHLFWTYPNVLNNPKSFISGWKIRWFFSLFSFLPEPQFCNHRQPDKIGLFQPSTSDNTASISSVVFFCIYHFVCYSMLLLFPYTSLLPPLYTFWQMSFLLENGGIASGGNRHLFCVQSKKMYTHMTMTSAFWLSWCLDDVNGIVQLRFSQTTRL